MEKNQELHAAMTANLMNLHIAKGPKVTADKLLGRTPKNDGSWKARMDLFMRSMAQETTES